MANKTTYTVKKLADLAKVSVRTLHLYDEIGLLKPSVRTEAGYRLYGEPELLRLQQILLYKELDLSLQNIGDILDNPEFNLLDALESHKEALLSKKERLTQLLQTIDKTINKMKNGMALTHEELYMGFPDGKANEYREKAIENYGSEQVERSENYLKSLGKEGFDKLKKESSDITSQLVALMSHDPESKQVQQLIAKHYDVIRRFWGTHGSSDRQAQAYAGLGDLYLSDERFTRVDGKPNSAFALFMNKAMKAFAKTLS